MDLTEQNLPTLVNSAQQALAKATNWDDLRNIRDRAEFMRTAAEKLHASQDALNSCAELKVRAEREMGAWLRDLDKHKGGRPAENPSQDATTSAPIKLKELEITKSDSSRFQRIASMTPEAFEAWMARAREKGEITTAGALKEAKSIAKRETAAENRAMSAKWDMQSLDELVESGQRMGVIYADPPWDFETWGERGEDRSAVQQYGTMSLEALGQMGQWVKDISADDCALFMWTTDSHLPDALRLMNAWGFEYKTVGFYWAKTTNDGQAWHKGMGLWTRSNPEMCLLGTRGSPERLSGNVMKLVVDGVREHSRKPDDVARRITELVGGPYLELFARERREGWFAWGNEVDGRTQGEDTTSDQRQGVSGSDVGEQDGSS